MAINGYDPSRHQIAPKVTPGKRYRKAVREQAQAAKQEAVKPKPNPLEYTPSTGSGRCDVNSGERNSVLTPGGMGQVVSHRLKFDPVDANQGVFFVAEGGGATKVDVVGRNKPGDLMFMVPAGLAAGDYTLEMRATIHGSEDMRTGVQGATLTVS